MYAAAHFPDLRASLNKNVSGPYSESVLLALKPPKRLSSSSVTGEDGGPAVIGGILQGGKTSWLARGPVFVTFPSGKDSSNSVFNFNRRYPGFHFIVTTCCPCEKFLLIGLKGVDGRGCVAVYNPLISKLIKAIDVPYPVSALELVSSCGGPLSSSRILSKNLHWLFGIVAVGTEEGHLYLLDLRFDSSECAIESAPSQIEIFPPAIQDVPTMREAVIEANGHMAFELQASCHEEGVFHFALPDDEIIQSFYPSDAAVTSLLYEPRVGSLFVGFAFGQFQIFCLGDMSLVYSSELPETSASILRFSFQEPENDPRNFCYLWVAKGSNSSGDDSREENAEPLVLYMFQLAFFKKEVLPRLGPADGKSRSQVLYKKFELCGLRFEHSLGTGLISDMSECFGSTLLLCSSAEKYPSEYEHEEDDLQADDYCLSPSSSICMFGWLSPRARKHKCRGRLKLIAFDINRWYMAHMPNSFRGDDDDFVYSAYWAFDSDGLKEDEACLGMGVPPDTIQHFASGMKPLPERYLLPSACSLICHLVSDKSSHQYTLMGYQRQVLNTAVEMKSSCLIDPKEMHNDMLASELCSKHTLNQVYTLDMMRENILTTALEHGQISFLLVVVRDLASGHLAACGCTLRSIMDWAWKSVANVKDLIDKLCVPIFDCSCSMLDTLVQVQLDFHTTQMSHLKIIFQKLMEYTEDSSAQSKEELKTKLNVVSLIHQYLKVVQWFIGNGLLPEQLDNADSGEEIMSKSGILIYKYTRLRQVFDQRREELNRLEIPDLLLIDGWIDEIGEPMTSRWLKEEGGKSTYPPPSFMTLLDMYYLDCLDLSSKHCLVMYLLLDVLAMFSTLEDEGKECQADLYEAQKDRLNNIGMFLHLFAVPMGLIKLTQAFWLLDHKNFEDALSVFLDADTSPPTASWQERRILRAFLHQGHPSMALKYISTRQPEVETVEDAKMHITIYIKSRELLKAWNLVQVSSGHHDLNELFSHLFTICQQHSQLDQFLKLPFSSVEEDMVVKYLQQSNNAEGTQILVLFHLQHSRYVEAIKLHSQNKHNRIMRDQSEESRRRNARLDHIIQSYVNLLPRIEREVSFASNKLIKHSSTVRRVMHKPSTLSGVLHPRLIGEAASHAGRLTNRMDKMDESRRNTRPPQMTPFRKKPQPGWRKAETENTFVYPTVTASAKKRYSGDVRSSLGQRSSLDRGSIAQHDQSLVSSRIIPPHMRDRRNSSLSVANMLLQTPPITRRRSSIARAGQEVRLEPMTPHSILKVKQLLIRSRSPSLSAISRNSSRSNSPVTRRTRTGSNASMQSESVDGDGNLISDDRLAVKNYQKTLESVDAQPTIRENIPFETPKRLRFAGLDSSANDSGLLSPIQQLPGVSSLTPVKVEAEDSKADDEMDVDVTGESMHEESRLKDSYLVDDDQDVNPQIELDEEEAESMEEDVDIESDAGEDAVPEEEVIEESDVQAMKPDSSEEDEVICLDSSSDEESQSKVVATAPVIQTESTEEDRETPADSLRLVLSSEESSELEENPSPPAQALVEEDVPTILDVFHAEDDMEEQHSPVIQLILPAKNDNNVETKEKDVGIDLSQQNVGSIQEQDVLSEEIPSEDVAVKDDNISHKELQEDPAETTDHRYVAPEDENQEEDDIIKGRDENLIELHLSEEEEDVVPVEEPGCTGQVPSTEQLDIEVISSDEDGKVPSLLPLGVQEEAEVISDNDDDEDAHQPDDHPVEIQPYSGTEAKEEGGDMGTLQLSGDDEISSLEEEEPLQKEEALEVPVSPVIEPIEPVSIHLPQEIMAPNDDFEVKAIKSDEEEKVEKVEMQVVADSKVDAIKSDEIKNIEEDVKDAQQTAALPVFETSVPESESITKKEEKPLPQTVIVTVEVSDKEPKQPVLSLLPIQVSAEAKPSTPVVERVREEPTFALSPPVTRRSTRKSTRLKAALSPEANVVFDARVGKSPSRSTRQSFQHLKAPEPEFLFSPPTTRKRTDRRKGETTPDGDKTLPAKSPPRSAARRTRGSLKFSEVDSDQSSVAASPPRTSKRATSRSRSTKKRESSPEAQVAPTTPSRKTRKKDPATEKTRSPSTPSRRTRKRQSSTEEKTSPALSTRGSKTSGKTHLSPPRTTETKETTTPEKTAPSTPSRKTRQSPGRKLQATPTRSSSRVRARMQMSEQQEKASESESQATDVEASVPRKTRRRKSQAASDVSLSETESEAGKADRRNTRAKVKSKRWSPGQDKTKLIELGPLQEEEEEVEVKAKRGRPRKTASGSRAARSSANIPIKMRRKAKVFTLEE